MSELPPADFWDLNSPLFIRFHSFGFDQAFRQALDASTGADVIYSIDGFMIEFTQHNGLLKTRFCFANSDLVRTGDRLAQATADTKPLLDDGVKARLR